MDPIAWLPGQRTCTARVRPFERARATGQVACRRLLTRLRRISLRVYGTARRHREPGLRRNRPRPSRRDCRGRVPARSSRLQTNPREPGRNVALSRRITAMAHLGRAVDTTRVGVFGHSLGGSTAAHIAAADRRVDCAADLAGSVFALPPSSQFKRPFMILSSQKVDGTLVRFWPRLHGKRWWVKLAGALHFDLSDWAWLAPHLKRLGITPLSAHQVARGRPSTTIERRYLDSFFARCLKQQPVPLLAGNPPFRGVSVLR
jgi:hypothetical protein